MRIPCNLGEQIGVDWTVDPAHIIPDVGKVINAWLFVGTLAYSQYAFMQVFTHECTNS